MAVSLTFRTYLVDINGTHYRFRAESEESAKKKAQTYCIAERRNNPALRNPVIKVIGIAP